MTKKKKKRKIRRRKSIQNEPQKKQRSFRFLKDINLSFGARWNFRIWDKYSSLISGLTCGYIVLVLFWLFFDQFAEAELKLNTKPYESWFIVCWISLPLVAILLRRLSRKLNWLNYFLALTLGAALLVSCPFSAFDSLGVFRFYPILISLFTGALWLTLRPKYTMAKFSWPLEDILKLKRYGTTLLLFILFAIGFGFRIWDHVKYGLYVDENHHIQFAYNYFNNIPNDYFRAPIISYLTIFMTWLGGAEQYHDYFIYGRIPSILFGALTVVPIYLLGSKVSKFTGFVAAYLWAIYPWSIGFSVYIREYSLFVFIGAFAFYMAIDISTRLFDFKKDHLKRMLIFGIALLVLSLYAILIDPHSTMKAVFLISGILAVSYSVLKAPEFIWKYKLKGLSIALISIVLISVLAYFFHTRFTDGVWGGYHDVRWYEVFFKADRMTPMHWWDKSGTSLYIPFMLLSGSLLLAFIHRKHFVVLSLLLTMGLLLQAYYWAFSQYFRPKYLTYLSPVFTVLCAAFITGMIRFIFSSFAVHKYLKYGTVLGATVLLLTIFNIRNSFSIKVNPPFEYGYLLTCGEYHYNYLYTKQIIENRIHDLKDRKIITTVFKRLLMIDYHIPQDEIQTMTAQSQGSVRRAYETIATHDKGVMLLDIIRNQAWGQGMPIRNKFSYAGKKIDMIVNENWCQIYLWDILQPGEEYLYPSIN